MMKVYIDDLSILSKMQVIDVYTKKEYECKKCGGKVYYGKIAKDDGSLYTKDGQAPNGKFGKESNVLSGAVDATVKDRLHACSEKFVLRDIAAIEGGQQVIAPTPKAAPQQQEPDYSNFSPEFVSETEAGIWREIIAKTTEYSILAQKQLTEYPEIQNPALKGLITKIAFEVLAKIKDAERSAN